jgi:hypothetical protein
MSAIELLSAKYNFNIEDAINVLNENKARSKSKSKVVEAKKEVEDLFAQIVNDVDDTFDVAVKEALDKNPIRSIDEENDLHKRNEIVLKSVAETLNITETTDKKKTKKELAEQKKAEKEAEKAKKEAEKEALAEQKKAEKEALAEQKKAEKAALAAQKKAADPKEIEKQKKAAEKAKKDAEKAAAAELKKLEQEEAKKAKMVEKAKKEMEKKMTPENMKKEQEKMAKELEKQKKAAEKELEKEKKEAEKKAAKEAKEAEKKAATEAKKLEKKAPKAKAANKVEAKVEEDAPVKVTVKRVKIGDQEYLKSSANILYNPVTQEEVGIYDEATNSIKPLPDDEEEELEEDNYDN